MTGAVPCHEPETNEARSQPTPHRSNQSDNAAPCGYAALGWSASISLITQRLAAMLLSGGRRPHGGSRSVSTTFLEPHRHRPLNPFPVPLIYEHLEAGRDLAKNGVDLFIHSNGGSGTVPWRIVNLIRQYTEEFVVLVPHRAFSAATLIALGADKIIMHKIGCLGPIDPSVANAFNPQNPQQPGQLVPISVEDVTAFFKLVKEEVGITHEDELVQAFIAMTDKVHPLALGNVQRSHNQLCLMASKLLKLHTDESKEHEIVQLIDTLKSNLFFHGHPINREESQKDLMLKVVIPCADLESKMWELYVQYERDLKLSELFNPLRELKIKLTAPVTSEPLRTEEILQQMQLLAQHGIALGNPGVTEEQIVKLAAALVPFVSGRLVPFVSGRSKPLNEAQLDPIVGAFIESVNRIDVFKTDLKVERSIIPTPAGPQEVVKQELLWRRWEQED